MAGTLKFELVTPERIALAGDARQVVVPGLEGEFTVLPGHAPVISQLRPGVIEVTLADAPRTRMFVKGGIAELAGDRLVVLAERALEEDAMDATIIAAELEVAEAELASATDDAAKLSAAFAVARLRAMAR
jgi:F-type H+-transporting ATPase subunit epsilon